MRWSGARRGLAAGCGLWAAAAIATAIPAAIATAIPAAIATAPASAGIINATSLLPPGESGFVSIPGVAAGTASPHLYDQQQAVHRFQPQERDVRSAGQRGGSDEGRQDRP